VVIANTTYIGNNAFNTNITNPALVMKGVSSTGTPGQYYTQSALLNGGSNTGSADYIAYVDTYPGPGNDHGWVDMGITGSQFSDPNFTITKPQDGYIFTGAVASSGAGGNLVFATDSTSAVGDMVWATGGFLAANEVMRFNNTGKYLIIETGTSSTSNTSGALQVLGGAAVKGNLFADSITTSSLAINGNTSHVGNVFINASTSYLRFPDGTIQNTNAASFAYSTSSYAQANAATNSAQAAYTNSNSAYIQANAANSLATSAYFQANLVGSIANTAVQRAGDVMSGTLTINSNLNVSGNVTSNSSYVFSDGSAITGTSSSVSSNSANTLATSNAVFIAISSALAYSIALG
jgi:hypothetical protein